MIKLLRPLILFPGYFCFWVFIVLLFFVGWIAEAFCDEGWV